MDLIAIAGILITIGIAVWQSSRAQAAKRKNEKELTETHNKFAKRLDEIVSMISSQSSITSESPDQNPFFHVQLADVNNDSIDELIIQIPAGAHASLVKIFAASIDELQELGEIGWGTPAKFEVIDIDGDGQLEIIGKESDWENGLPYYLAPQMKVIFKWNGSVFEERGMIKDYTVDDIRRLKRQLEDDLRRETTITS